jgi:hypothetical protein
MRLLIIDDAPRDTPMDGSSHEPVLIGKAANPAPGPQIEKVHRL